MDVHALRQQMPPLKDRVYLNTGTSGPVPLDAARAGEELLQLIVNEGFATPKVMEAYMRALDHAREAIARVIGASTSDIALTHSASEGIGTVAAGIDWRPGDEVIISDLEHISGIAPWTILARSRGVKIVNLQSVGGNLSGRQIEDAITDSTRLICISHVSYATGAELPVKEVCAIARQRGVMVVIDGAQSAGHVPIDVEEIGCDFYALPGQKWLLGHEGTGGLFVSQSALSRLEPSRIGWASLSHEDATQHEVSLHAGARRFETGTVHAPAFATLTASIGMLESIGWDQIFARAKSLANMARTHLAEIDGVEIVTPQERATGLLTFALRGVEPSRVVRHLWERCRVIIRSIPHPAALRASFHAFNNEEDVRRLVDGVKSAAIELRG